MQNMYVINIMYVKHNIIQKWGGIMEGGQGQGQMGGGGGGNRVGVDNGRWAGAGGGGGIMEGGHGWKEAERQRRVMMFRAKWKFA